MTKSGKSSVNLAGGRIATLAVVMAAALLWPTPGPVSAQTIGGTVSDETRGVLPGVTLEARSPALIEQVRAAVTDGNGQYRIVALEPGQSYGDPLNQFDVRLGKIVDFGGAGATIGSFLEICNVFNGNAATRCRASGTASPPATCASWGSRRAGCSRWRPVELLGRTHRWHQPRTDVLSLSPRWLRRPRCC